MQLVLSHFMYSSSVAKMHIWHLKNAIFTQNFAMSVTSDLNNLTQLPLLKLACSYLHSGFVYQLVHFYGNRK